MASTSSMPPATSVDSNQSLSPEQSEALKAATFQRLHPRIYLERFLNEGIRPDGRSISLNSSVQMEVDAQTDDVWRNVEVNVGSISTASGSALVRLGSTTIVCGVKAEICEPELDRPDEGFLVPNIDLPALCSPKFKPGPPTEEAQVLSERVNEVFVEHNILPLSSLCIHPGKSAWVLYVDATVINYDGNVFDAAILAMICALRNTTLPHATYDAELNRTICSLPDSDPSKPALKLRLQEDLLPLAFSFGVFAGTYILADPTAFEEPLLDTTVSVLLDAQGNVLAASQLGAGIREAAEGGDNVDGRSGEEKDSLSQCIALAKKRHGTLKSIVYG